MGIQFHARVTGSIDIAAAPEVIFAMVTDLPRMGEWSPENRGGQWQKGATEAAVGARFLGNNVNGTKKWDVAVEVSELAPPTRFAFRTVWFGMAIARWSYDLRPTPDGCTVTESWEDLRPAFAAWLLGKKITNVHDRATFTRQSIDTTLANLKRSAEALTAA
ncbi:MAG TPA: SRPBCC family protein [Sporichthya sp.]|nr:SRPBCC family protein [Sporichthya sp.]